ncbi:MAG: hypothetical protein KIT62_05880 [Cyclobacteriaceae bacterium]|nr:hypothetical protein [Cyclobacteriaceae bacterium]
MLRVVIGGLMIIFAFVQADGQQLLTDLIHTSAPQKTETITRRVDAFVTRLAGKRESHTEKEFLQLIFAEAHRRHFKTYKPYTRFSEVFDKGRYDCLSATSFLAVVLQAFEYDFHIVETNYHIFISVQTSSGPVLLESTDRLNGFVEDVDQIQERITSYRQNKLQAADGNKVYHQFDLNLYQVVKPHQLSGLLLFNQAIVAFNNRDLADSAEKLKRAVQIYDSPRTSEFAAILITAIIHSSIHDEIKKELISPFSKYLHSSNTVAAR